MSEEKIQAAKTTKSRAIQERLPKTTVETHTNAEMENMLISMEPFLETARGRLGYAVARNTRKLQEAADEYLQTRQQLINELGEEEIGEDGKPTGVVSIEIGTKECEVFADRIAEFSNISHDVEIVKVPPSSIPDTMTAFDILRIYWMIEEGEDLEKAIGGGESCIEDT